MSHIKTEPMEHFPEGEEVISPIEISETKPEVHKCLEQSLQQRSAGIAIKQEINDSLDTKESLSVWDVDHNYLESSHMNYAPTKASSSPVKEECIKLETIKREDGFSGYEDMTNNAAENEINGDGNSNQVFHGHSRKLVQVLQNSRKAQESDVNPSSHLAYLQRNCQSSDVATVLGNNEMPSGTGKDKNIMCEVCGKRYKFKSCLKKHMIIHTKEKTFQCEVCQRKFGRNYILTVHKRTHTGEYPYSCDLCGKTFNQSGDLSRHKIIHSMRIKPYSCVVCGRGFYYKYHLKRHGKIHTGEKTGKSWICDLCGKAFDQHCNLNMHLKIHSGEKPYICNLCGKRFIYRVSIEIHISIHLGMKSYICEVCGKAYNYRNGLDVHQRIHTK